jgi:hypothetical protein
MCLIGLEVLSVLVLLLGMVLVVVGIGTKIHMVSDNIVRWDRHIGIVYLMSTSSFIQEVLISGHHTMIDQ